MPLHIQTTDLAPRSVQVTAHPDGFTLSWDQSPPYSSNIISHAVICTTEQETSLTISMVASGTDTSVSIPLTLSSDTQYCVTAVTRKPEVGVLFERSCVPALLPMRFTKNEKSENADVILLSALGSVAAASFLVLVFLTGSMLACLVVSKGRTRKRKGNATPIADEALQSNIAYGSHCRSNSRNRNNSLTSDEIYSTIKEPAQL